MDGNKKIGIIGCGNMGEAIARGIIASDIITGNELHLYDIEKEKAVYLKDSLIANVDNSAEELVKTCDTILIAVKAQDVNDLLREVWHCLDAAKLVISIAAGVTIEKIKKVIREEVRVARVMPNMAAFIRQSISALCYDSYATTEDMELIRGIFKSVGDIVEVEESNMDAVTAVSGSGPAYFFYLVETLEKSAVSMGVDKRKARQLAVKTALGSAALLKDSDFDAEKLRRRVTSKGGTTEAAFRFFTEKKLGEILRKGIEEAAKRSKDLRKGS